MYYDMVVVRYAITKYHQSSELPPSLPISASHNNMV